MKLYLTIAECLDTNNEYSTEVYPCTSGQEAGDMATSLIADMIETMDIEDIDPTEVWELEGDGWFYRVRIEEQDFIDDYAEPTNPDSEPLSDIESDEYGFY